MLVCNCSGVQRFWHSDLASSSADWRAFSYSERVMISLLTLAMISSMVFPLLGSTAFGAGAIPGFSSTGVAGLLCGAGGFAWGADSGLSCAASGRAAHSTAITARFRITFLVFPV